MFELLKASRDFYISIVVLFAETYCYYTFSYLLMTYLIDQVGLGNVYAGLVYAAFGGVLMVFTMALGSLIDVLLLRRTLQLYLATSFLASILFALSSGTVWTCLVLVLLSFSLAIGMPSISVAIRRFTAKDAQTQGFVLLFMTMNVATALSQVSVDLFRMKLIPLDRSPDVASLSAYSLLFGFMALIHFVSFVMVTLGVRDVYVTDAYWTMEKFVPIQRTTPSRLEILRLPAFWYFVMLSLATTGAKSVYRYLDSLYPLYMRRSAFSGLPYMSLLLLNPLLACILTPLFGWLMIWLKAHPFDVILLGCIIAAGAPYLMILPSIWGVLGFISLMTLGEALWAPMLQRYTSDFCKPGTEGIFMALATIPLFAAKIISGSLAGILLEAYCASKSSCDQGWIIWLIIGGITTSSPVLLLATCRWTRLKLSRL